MSRNTGEINILEDFLLNLFDLIILSILITSVARGLYRGLLKELFSFAGLLAGFYLAISFYSELGQYAANLISDGPFLDISCFFAILLTCTLVMNLVGILINYLIKLEFIRWVDISIGGGFGFVKGILTVAIVLAVFAAFLPAESAIVRNSKLSSHFVQVSDKLAIITSKSIKTEYVEKIKMYKRLWKT
jgi:membrane protein required for colicin V production